MHALVSTSELADLLGDSRPPVLLDVRWALGGPPGRESYMAGHLPGAVFLDLDADLAAAPGERGRHPLPEPDDLREVLRSAGVNGTDAVVVYDDGNGSVAARAWWLLRWIGHSNVAVLDGGYSAWQQEQRPVTTEVPQPQRGDLEIRPGSMPTVDADGAAALARSGVLLDARVPERYRGETEPVDPRAGHIPGAVNAPFTGHTSQDGRWLPAAELAERFRSLGVHDPSAVGAYCGSGVTASSVVLALEVAGVTDPARPAVLYPGSWSEWSRDPQRPAETGP
nr:sulfurtransferase [Kibdelosporangium sp. MJ126-NF4]CEL14761.1 Thiosulfate sulfurtransferase, rhodanese [Kibdelosporangium sp. MJ126-NF4]CTQ96609.1 Thiosulfate sulfurtransferase, rhodanese (EC 2.8.1.1) [Kibdelosporangium sp. MJ126-NF4]